MATNSQTQTVRQLIEAAKQINDATQNLEDSSADPLLMDALDMLGADLVLILAVVGEDKPVKNETRKEVLKEMVDWHHNNGFGRD